MCLCFVCTIFLGDIKTHLFDVNLIFRPYVYVLSIISTININIRAAHFENIYLSSIIWQINCYDDRLSSIQVIAAIAILFLALIDIINACFTLSNDSNTGSTNKSSNHNNINENENDNISINTATSYNSKSTNLKENNNHDVMKISFATQTSGKAFICGTDFIHVDAQRAQQQQNNFKLVQVFSLYLMDVFGFSGINVHSTSTSSIVSSGSSSGISNDGIRELTSIDGNASATNNNNIMVIVVVQVQENITENKNIKTKANGKTIKCKQYFSNYTEMSDMSIDAFDETIPLGDHIG